MSPDMRHDNARERGIAGGFIMSSAQCAEALAGSFEWEHMYETPGLEGGNRYAQT
jgi:hypothetical protein